VASLLTFAASLVGGAALIATGSRMELAGVRGASKPAYIPLDPEGPAMPLQRYKLRIYDGQYEVLHRNRFVVDVDLDSLSAGPILNTQFAALIQIAKHANEPMDAPLMKICDLATGKPLQDWVG
jgi:hypothetical protein